MSNDEQKRLTLKSKRELCSDVMTGDYEIEITTKDGTVAAYEQIKIIDSKA